MQTLIYKFSKQVLSTKYSFKYISTQKQPNFEKSGAALKSLGEKSLEIKGGGQEWLQ